MMKVKFCGLKRPCDVFWANRLQPDYVGFVFAGRKRRISDLQARKLRKFLNRKIPAVGVFVNEPAEHIIRLVQKDIIQAVQLHGQEGEAGIRRIRQAVSCPIIQAFSLNGDEDVARAEKSGADYILLDAAGGGSGERFNWKWLCQIRRPFFLAGGLTAECIEEASRYHPFALDVSSGIETDGFKDKKKMEKFIREARRI